MYILFRFYSTQRICFSRIKCLQPDIFLCKWGSLCLFFEEIDLRQYLTFVILALFVLCCGECWGQCDVILSPWLVFSVWGHYFIAWIRNVLIFSTFISRVVWFVLLLSPVNDLAQWESGENAKFNVGSSGIITVLLCTPDRSRVCHVFS